MELSNVLPTAQKIEIYHPGTGVKTGLVFHMRPPHSAEVQAVIREHRDKTLARKGKVSDAEITEHGHRLFAAAITGWEWGGDATWHGERPEYSEVKLKEVLTSQAGESFIVKQLMTAFSDGDSFFTS